jgi:hypothetical protein
MNQFRPLHLFFAIGTRNDNQRTLRGNMLVHIIRESSLPSAVTCRRPVRLAGGIKGKTRPLAAATSALLALVGLLLDAGGITANF